MLKLSFIILELRKTNKQKNKPFVSWSDDLLEAWLGTRLSLLRSYYKFKLIIYLLFIDRQSNSLTYLSLNHYLSLSFGNIVLSFSNDVNLLIQPFTVYNQLSRYYVSPLEGNYSTKEDTLQSAGMASLFFCCTHTGYPALCYVPTRFFFAPKGIVLMTLWWRV